MKIRPVKAELLPAGTYRRTNITKLIVAFRIISHAPENSKIKKISYICAEFFCAGLKGQLRQRWGRILLGDNTSGGAVMFCWDGVRVSFGLPCIRVYLGEHVYARCRLTPVRNVGTCMYVI